MPITNRKAILISSPFSTGTDLGTDKDIELWQKFLESPNGGCWKNTEIQPLNSPTAPYVISCIQGLRNAHLDYLFFVFSGHGQNTSCGDVVFPFSNMTDFLPVSAIIDEIKNLNIDATIIIDACRLTSSPSIAQNNQQGTNPPPKSNICFRPVRNEASITIAHKWKTSTHLYIGEHEKVLLIQSCSYNEEARMAEYSDIKCSLFTSELIKVGLAASNSMSIQDAFSKAAKSTVSISKKWSANRVQHPYISNVKIYHPFCLGLKEIDEAEKAEQEIRQKFIVKH